MMRLACLAMAMGLIVAAPALADPITLNPTMIANVYSGPGQNINNGGGPYLIQASNDGNQGLLSFDLSSIKVPVAAATLKIYQASPIYSGPQADSGMAPQGTYDIYRNTSTWQQTRSRGTRGPVLIPHRSRRCHWRAVGRGGGEAGM